MFLMVVGVLFVNTMDDLTEAGGLVTFVKKNLRHTEILITIRNEAFYTK